MQLNLYAHPLSSFCWKVLIALYEKQIPFEYLRLEPGSAESEEFSSLWPIGKFPLLRDGERVIVETSVIIEYLDLHHEREPRLIPSEADSAIEVRMLDRTFDQYVMTPMQKIVFNRFCPAEARNAFDVMAARTTIEKAYGWLEGRLDRRPFAAGETFSLADCAAGPSLHYANRVQPMNGQFPGLAGYLERLEERPSFARVLEEAEQPHVSGGSGSTIRVGPTLPKKCRPLPRYATRGNINPNQERRAPGSIRLMP